MIILIFWLFIKYDNFINSSESMASAYVLINCELGSEESVISQLKSLDAVKEVHGTFGRV